MTKHGALAIVVVLTIGGFALRVYRIDAVPLRGDEAFSVMNWARQPLAESLVRTATREPHPPLTYVLFRGWGLLAGTGEFSMRLLPALFNVIGVPAMFALGHHIGGRRMGELAALLWALHPYQIWQAQDARNYAVWAGMSSMALWLGVRTFRFRRRVDWLLYLLVATVTIQIYYLELFTQAALALYGAITEWRDRRFLLRWLAGQVFVVTTAAVSFLVLQGQLFTSNGYGGTAGQGLDVPRLFTWFLPTLVFGEKILPAGFAGLLWPVVLVILLASLVLLWRHDRNNAMLLALLGFLPLILIGLISLKLNVFRPHYTLSAVPAYILMISALVLGVGQLSYWATAFRRFLPAVLLGGWLTVAGYSLWNYYFVPAYAKASNWPALTDYLRTRLEPNDLVIQAAADAAFGFYYDAPNDDIALPADPQQSPQEIARILDQTSKHYRSLWLVGQTFPDWPNVGVVETWMQSHMQLVRQTQVQGLRIEQYMPWQVRLGEAVTSPQATFEDVVELVGVNVFTPPEPTGKLTVWAYWHPLHTTRAPLKVFVHLLGATNPVTGTPLWTQDDQFPQDGLLSTTNWQGQGVFRDVYTLPVSSVPAGDYRLVIGFYDPATGDRLPVNGGDSYEIQSLQLP